MFSRSGSNVLYSMMWKIAILLVSCCVPNLLADDASPRRGYVITAPRILQARTNEQVCITLYDINSDGTIIIQLLDSNRGSQLSSVSTTIKSDVSSACVELYIPNTRSGHVSLAVNGQFEDEGNYTIQNSRLVAIISHSPITFIQTDKPVYKPGQTVKFRIIQLDHRFIPIVKKLTVWVETAQGVRVMEWRDQEPSREGLYDFQFPLSKEPTLGEWKISTKDKDNDIVIQTFKVDEFVLPKFEVVVHPPRRFTDQDQHLDWEVCAKYTYGQAVAGVLETRFIHRGRHENFIHKEIIEIKGCRKVELARVHLETLVARGIVNNIDSLDVDLLAVVTENGTGISRNSSSTYRINKEITVTFLPEDHIYFKPGITYRGTLQLKGENVSGVEVNVCSTQLAVKTCDVLTPDQDGRLTFHIQPVKLVTKADIEVRVDGKITGTRQLRSWFSPTDSYIQLERRIEPVTCGPSHQQTVWYSGITGEVKFNYQVISRGNIVYTNAVQRFLNSSGQFEVDFPALPVMSPTARLLGFLVTGSGEIVSDSMELPVHACTGNKVSLEFESTEAYPGSQLLMKVKAAPASLCSVSAIDRSMHLLSGHNTLNTEKLFKSLDLFHIMKTSPPSLREGFCRIDGSNPRLRPPPSSTWELRRKRSLWVSPIGRSDYVDSLTAFNEAGFVVLSDLTLETRPCAPRLSHRVHNWRRTGPPGAPGSNRLEPGIGPTSEEEGNLYDRSIIMPRGPQAHSIEPLSISAPMPQRRRAFKPVVQIRTLFPETWLWELHKVRESGEVSVHREVPHTITEWVGSSFCVSRGKGLGISQPTTLRAFQPFFLSLTLPYSVKRGELVPLGVSVFNYLDACLPLKMSLELGSGYELVNKNETKKSFCLCGEDTFVDKFTIRPLVLGSINITVFVQTTSSFNCTDSTGSVGSLEQTTARDAVVKQLLVEAEGHPVEISKSHLVCLKDPEGGDFTAELDFTLPENVVEGSARAYVSVVGDVMGPTLDGLENLVQLPYGCGEQNMVKFVPNVVVLQYLISSGQITEEFKNRAQSNLETGYQRQLKYQRQDGSFSAFGDNDSQGSTWLTAFVLRSFAQAQTFISVDAKLMNRSVRWIIKHQSENGCFYPGGRLLDGKMTGGVGGSEGSVALTSYVLLSLLESGYDITNSSRQQALDCVMKAVTSQSDVYSLALASYVTSLVGHEAAQQYLDILESKASYQGGAMFWEGERKSRALSVEVGSYVLLTLTTLGQPHHIIQASKVAKWIVQQRNSHGGFVSTQDTVVALQALSQYTTLTKTDTTDVTVLLAVTAAEQVTERSLEVTTDNAMVTQTIDIPSENLPATVTVSATGEGCAVVQSVLRYNTEAVETSPAFDLEVKLQTPDINTCGYKVITVCTKFNDLDRATNMAVLEVNMVSGFEPGKDSMKKLQSDLKVKRWEVEGNSVNFYFDELTSVTRCLTFDLTQTVEVGETKPAGVKVYDYYQPELVVHGSYSINATCVPELDLPEPKSMPGNDDDDSEIDPDWLTELESQIVTARPNMSPQIIIEDSSRDVATGIEGSIFKLRCAGRGQPTPRVIWRMGNGDYIDPDTIQEAGEYLIFPRLTVNQTGAYVCTLHNGVDPAVSKRINLQVQEREPFNDYVLEDDYVFEPVDETMPPPVYVHPLGAAGLEYSMPTPELAPVYMTLPPPVYIPLLKPVPVVTLPPQSFLAAPAPLDNFVNVDFDLDIPKGVEGVPEIIAPPPL